MLLLLFTTATSYAQQDGANDPLFADIRWCVEHEGVRLFDAGTQLRDANSFRIDCAQKQSHNPPVSAAIHAASDARLVAVMKALAPAQAGRISQAELQPNIAWCILHEGVQLFTPSGSLRAVNDFRNDCARVQRHNPPVATAVLTAPDDVVLASMRAVQSSVTRQEIQQNFDWAARHERHDLIFLDMVILKRLNDIRAHYYSLQSHSPRPGLMTLVSDRELADKTVALFHKRGVDRTDPSNFNIKIVREYSDPRGTFGHLEVNGREYMKTLERSDTLIPEGDFVGNMRYQSKKGFVLNEDFLIEVQVPGREHILVHIGNTPADGTGCILVGTAFAHFPVKTASGDIKNVPGVEHSAVALGRLRTLFYGLPDAAKANANSCPVTAIRVAVTKSPTFRHIPDRPLPSPSPGSTASTPDRPIDRPDHDSIAEIRREQGTNCRPGESESVRESEMREFDRGDRSNAVELRAGESRVESAGPGLDVGPPD